MQHAVGKTLHLLLLQDFKQLGFVDDVQPKGGQVFGGGHPRRHQVCAGVLHGRLFDDRRQRQAVTDTHANVQSR